MDILHWNTTFVVPCSIPHPVTARLLNRPWLSGSQEETHWPRCIQILHGLYSMHQTGHTSRRERGDRTAPDSSLAAPMISTPLPRSTHRPLLHLHVYVSRLV